MPAMPTTVLPARIDGTERCRIRVSRAADGLRICAAMVWEPGGTCIVDWSRHKGLRDYLTFTRFGEWRIRDSNPYRCLERAES